MKEKGKTKYKTFGITYVFMAFNRPWRLKQPTLGVHLKVNNVGRYIEICILQFPLLQHCGQAYVWVRRARDEALRMSQRTRGSKVAKALARVVKREPAHWLFQSLRQQDEICTRIQWAKLVRSPQKIANWRRIKMQVMSSVMWILWLYKFGLSISFKGSMKSSVVVIGFLHNQIRLTHYGSFIYIFCFVMFLTKDKRKGEIFG